MSNAITFIPWVRKSVADLISSQTADGRPLFDVQAAVKATLADGTSSIESADPVSLEGYGPGDIKSVNPEQIRRLEPKKATLDFEPNYLPFIEFSDPTLPWLFSPEATDAAASSLNGLLPWMCLLVVPEADDVSIEARTSAPNPVLTVGSTTMAPGSGFVLPDLDGSNPDLPGTHWWAHVQVAGGGVQSAADFEQILDASPERVTSRVICPVKLKPETKYVACLVPTYRRGAQAGLGQTVDAGGAEMAWPAPKTQDADGNPIDPQNTIDSLMAPVYFHWRFRTGRAGDFESLARRLETYDATGNLGSTTVQIDLAEFGLATESDAPEVRYTTMNMQGVLRAPAQSEPQLSEVDPDIQQTFENELLVLDPRSDLPKTWAYVYNDLDTAYASPSAGVEYDTMTDAKFRSFGDGAFEKVSDALGYLYVPVGGGPFNELAVFSIDLLDPANRFTYVGSTRLPENPGPAGSNASWVAHNPRNGLLYSSAFYETADAMELLVYRPTIDPNATQTSDRVTVNFVGRMPLFSDDGFRTPFEAKRIQGGAFSSEGHLYLVRDTSDTKGGVYGFEMISGRQMVHIPITSPFGSNEGALPTPRTLQGIDVSHYVDPNDATRVTQLHVVMSQDRPAQTTIKHLGVPAGEEGKV